jgi:hypothetical protein
MTSFIATMAALLFVSAIAPCNAASIADLKAAIEGVYILDEWTIDGKTFRPPEVEGRSVIVDGNILTILTDTTEASKRTYNTLMGTYYLISTSFTYTCNSRTGFTQTPDNISLSRALPFGGKPRECT